MDSNTKKWIHSNAEQVVVRIWMPLKTPPLGNLPAIDHSNMFGIQIPIAFTNVRSLHLKSATSTSQRLVLFK